MRFRSGLFVLVTSGACAHVSTPGASFALPRAERWVDLTHAFDAQTPYWPDKPPGKFELTRDFCRKVPPSGQFFCTSHFAAPEHGGTHLDAPLHFAEAQASVADVTLSQLIAPAVILDLSAAARNNPDASLSAADIAAFEAAHGPILPGTIVLVRTGWAERWPDRLRYYGSASTEDDSDLHFPGLAEDAAHALVARRVAAVGIDTASVDPGQSKKYAAHKTLLGASIVAFENLDSLARLPPTGAVVFALPMKIGAGTGAPLRIVALLPESG